MLLIDATKNSVLDSLGLLIDLVSVHDGYPGTDGSNEIAATTRQAITWNVAAAGSLDNNANPAFTIPAANTVRWLGLWFNDVADVYRGCTPAGGQALKKFIGNDTDDVITCDNNGYADTDAVVLWGDGLPTGLAEGTVYFIRDVTTDTFKLAATSGGAAIDLTADGDGWVQKIVSETFGGEGTYTVSDLDIPLGAVT